MGLPAAHEGGHLRVTHGGQTHTFRFDAALVPARHWGADPAAGHYSIGSERGFFGPGVPDEAARKEAHARRVRTGLATPKVCFAAFFGDALHEVRRVSAGLRVALAYVLRPDGPSAVSPHVPAPAPAPAVTSDQGPSRHGVGSAPAPDLAKRTLPMLKAERRARGLPVSGTKAALLARLSGPAPGPPAAPAPTFMDETGCGAHARHFAQRLCAALADPKFLREGGRLGFACAHLHTSARRSCPPPPSSPPRGCGARTCGSGGWTRCWWSSRGGWGWR